MSEVPFTNPFRPGAGHMPPYLAGRRQEKREFLRLLEQDVILENLVLTGLRGVGKTVLLDTFKPLAIERQWWWVGTSLSESSSVTEDRLAMRLMTDLDMLTSSIEVEGREFSGMGFRPEKKRVSRKLDFDFMAEFYNQTPGLVSDKLKALLELVWPYMQREGKRGLIFAYDEAQTVSDHAAKDEYPLSMMLDVFQSIQKKGIPFMLVLVGLPTLFPKLVEARTFAERMFRVLFVDRLNENDSRDAILKPIQDSNCPVKMGDFLVQYVISDSGGYPYFVQFISREVFDALLQARHEGRNTANVSITGIRRKLDTDFFAGRWARATDRQRQLLTVIAHLPNSDDEFSVQDVAEKSKQILEKPIGPSQISQMLAKLADAGLVYRNRHGKYSFAVPLLRRFILRQQQSGPS